MRKISAAAWPGNSNGREWGFEVTGQAENREEAVRMIGGTASGRGSV